LGKVGNEILDDVGVREGVDAGLGLGVGGDAACESVSGCMTEEGREQREINIHKQARVLTPSMFMAQEPQMPSLQDRRKVRVGSSSFLILIRASNIMGPVLLRSRV